MRSSLVLLVVAILALSVGSANAHYELTRPVPRGVDANRQKNPPCGGFNTTQTNRVSLSSLSMFSIHLTKTHGNVEIFLGFGENLTVFPYKLGEKLNATMGTKYEIPLNYSAIPVDLVQLNSSATLQTVCHFSPTIDLYQCADLRIDVEGEEILTLQANSTVRIIAQQTGTMVMGGSTATSRPTATSTPSSASAIQASGITLLSIFVLCVSALTF
ncbi:hypothetical protein BJ742DRAFT_671267 [Cladochytrium replicatum]|nr:hypothetical protein BJ742DRAFT_671267 [Cladochytrium replicatum]